MFLLCVIVDCEVFMIVVVYGLVVGVGVNFVLICDVVIVVESGYFL